ncbi:ABC transporter permease domain-containing protein (plasmid) [Rhizobium gallicum bv. gallicum R602sp]|uniref:ABC transporter permease domain-containing protein n=1 Tax=Rhizobium gallicum bv. gallicum R602sp TaxID=1041138 RepID=A0A0B4XDI4_9HYPH|nr:ABC transporter permease domain-containing protein [Rhizobium gallicum bv. gallicum R602sp]
MFSRLQPKVKAKASTPDPARAFRLHGEWNSFLWPLIVTNGMEKATLPLGLTLFQIQQGNLVELYHGRRSDHDATGIFLAIVLQKVIYWGITIGSGFGGR